MDRRSFLAGTFGGIIAGGVIVAASDADIAKFASVTPKGKEIDVAPLLTPNAWAQVNDYVYNERGHIVGLVKAIDFDRKVIDVSKWGDAHMSFVGGETIVTYTVQAVGFVPPVHQRTK